MSGASLRAALVGYGRMGHALEEELEARGHDVVARLRSIDLVTGLAPDGVDVALEFTTPAAAPAVLKRLAEGGVPTVSGTTGWKGVEEVEGAFADAGVPFLHAPNFALGVHLLFRLAAEAGRAARRLEGYDAGIVERHHARKKDAPSGTARELARRYGEAAGHDVPVVALRQGGQPGEHRLVLEGPDETLEIVHRARSPRLFAQGAVVAAEWLVGTGRPGPVPFDDFLSHMFQQEEL